MDDLRQRVFDLWDEAQDLPDKDTIFRILIKAYGAIRQNNHFRAIHMISWAEQLIHGHKDGTHE